MLNFVLALSIGSLANWFIVSLTLAYDLAEPTLDWTDPKRALQGMVKTVARLIIVIVLGLSVALVYLLVPRHTALAMHSLLAYAALAIYQHQQLMRSAASLYDRIQI